MRYWIYLYAHATSCVPSIHKKGIKTQTIVALPDVHVNMRLVFFKQQTMLAMYNALILNMST